MNTHQSNTTETSQPKLPQTNVAVRCVHLKWLHTSDVHGALFAYDYLAGCKTRGGLSSFYAYSQRLKRQYADGLILTDGGDCLQGQPTSYYYNYIDTEAPHLVASMMNQMGYVAGVMGNHDLEAGHEVYDRWRQQLHFPLLGANIMDTHTAEPYLKPYTMIERQGIRIALLGLITPGIPNWLPEMLWSGMRFDEMVSSARKWMQIIQEREKPDLVVGLFHSGYEGGIVTPEYQENATRQVAEEVPGFDLILYGHDHRAAMHKVSCKDGKSVWCMGPSSLAVRCVEADIKIYMDDQGHILNKVVSGALPYLYCDDDANAHLLEIEFDRERSVLNDWVNGELGFLETDVHERDAFFGPSLFIDIVQQVQLEMTGADISFAAPVSFDSHLLRGKLRMSDMFSLYKYENFLCVVEMTGHEVKGFLEMSYALWTNQMQGPEDHCLLMDWIFDNGKREGLKNLAYNMEAAAGIAYTVDVTQPEGHRIHILHMADGSPFSLDKIYRVATNSYRANGGGELMTKGAGIPHNQLSSRVVYRSLKDLRYYLVQYVMQKKHLRPHLISDWKFIPETWTQEALRRDRELLFGHNSM